MKIYLDCCCYNRPFDQADSERVVIEAEAILGILRRIERGDWRLIVSDAVYFEIRRTPDAIRRESCLAMLSNAAEHVRSSTAVTEEARRLVEMGFKMLDAAHLAFARFGASDYFLTVDDRLLRKASSMGNIGLPPVVNPADWILAVEKDNA